MSQSGKPFCLVVKHIHVDEDEYKELRQIGARMRQPKSAAELVREGMGLMLKKLKKKAPLS